MVEIKHVDVAPLSGEDLIGAAEWNKAHSIELSTTARVLGRTTAGGGAAEELSAGTGISFTGGEVVNTAPDQTVVLTGGTGISTTGTYPNFTITNDAPHIATNLGITGSGNTRTITSSTGTDVTIPVATTSTAGWMSTQDKTKLDGVANNATANTGTVTSVAVSSGAGISVSGSPITTSGTITVTNDAPMVFPASGIAVSTGSAWGTSLTAPSGALVGTTDTQTLTNKTLTTPTLTGAPFVDGSYRGNVVAVAALDIDCSAGNYFTKSISANSTFTFSNVPASRAYAFTLAVTVSGDRAITWPASVEFPGDEAPTLTAGKTHLFMFATDNGGTTFRGAALADYEA